MRLWLISQTENNDYDTYDSAVVAALTEEDARQITPGSADYPREWTSPENVQVRLLGEAADGTEAGVILASYNAG